MSAPRPCKPPRPKRPWPKQQALLAGVLGLWLVITSPVSALSDAQQLVVEAWRLVNQSYVDPARFEAVHWKRLRQKTLEQPIETSTDAYEAISAMLAPLADPYTRLLRPQDYSTLMANTHGSVSGVGLQLALRNSDEQIVVISPLDGSPAADAGIPSGTAVLAVNGTSTQELGLEGTADALRGSAGSRVLLLLETPEGKRREVELERRTVDLQPVRHRVIRGGAHQVGYLRITQFSEPVPAQVQEVLTSEAFSAIDGLILDLRNNSGGLVSAGLAVANDLLDRQPIVTTQDRDGLSSPTQAGPGVLYGGPMVTLVNGGTASASEILAGALQDDGRSELLGSRTFGKGLIQTLIPLGDGSGLAVTVARYLTPSGRDIQNLGIEPNLMLPQPEPLNPGGDDDRWLERATAVLLEQLS